MALKLWDVDNGKVIYLKYTNNKNDVRLVKLKDPIEFDRIPISDLDKAIELIIRYVSSIKKLDNFGVVNSGKADKAECKSDSSVEIIKSDNNIETLPDKNIEDRPYVNIDQLAKIESHPDINVETDVNIEPWVKVSARPRFTIEPWVKRTKYDRKAEVKPDDNAETGHGENIEVKPDGNTETKHEVIVEDKPDDNAETKHDVIVEDKPDDNAEAKHDVIVETESDINVETKSDINVETKPAENYDIENGKREIPQEVNEKLDLLLQKDEGRIGGPQFLINKNAGKDVNIRNDSLSSSIIKTDISSILRGNAIIRNRIKERKKKGK
jgi:hypothetical protein